ncbi:myb family dna-binding domain-containing protein [Cystoisospora suis]|uniref:Myb family dna-binding domain-containing protein n=1 Tax=Cystoisospora suis TaxID=483139 RepID=A0A2C6L7C0_9APIC|nr:myb family dna-binding domain-containing protein [Cystoisospora suis]
MSLIREVLGISQQSIEGMLSLNERLLSHEPSIPPPPPSADPTLTRACSATRKERKLHEAIALEAERDVQQDPGFIFSSASLAKSLEGLPKDIRCAIMGGSGSLPSLPAVMHRPRLKRNSTDRRVIPPAAKWRLCAFTNSAREDGLCLVHWRRLSEQQGQQLRLQVAQNIPHPPDVPGVVKSETTSFSSHQSLHIKKESEGKPCCSNGADRGGGEGGGVDVKVPPSRSGEELRKRETSSVVESLRKLSFQGKLQKGYLVKPEKEYPFAKFNTKVDYRPISDDLYDKYIQHLDSSWTKEQTLTLWKTVHDYDLQWPVIFDVIPSSWGRSVEELKQRYYAVAKRLVARQFEEQEEEELAKGPGASNAALARIREERQRHPLIRFNFNLAAECQRRRLLDRQQRVGMEDLHREQELQTQIRSAEARLKKISKMRDEQKRLHKRFDLPADAAPPVRTHHQLAYWTWNMVAVGSFLELTAPTCASLSVLLENAKRKAYSEKFNNHIDSYLASIGVGHPSCYTYSIAEACWGLRSDVSTMLHLRQRVDKLKEELNYWTAISTTNPACTPAEGGGATEGVSRLSPRTAQPGAGGEKKGGGRGVSASSSVSQQSTGARGGNRGDRSQTSRNPRQLLSTSGDSHISSARGSRSPSISSGRAPLDGSVQHLQSPAPSSALPSNASLRSTSSVASAMPVDPSSISMPLASSPPVPVSAHPPSSLVSSAPVGPSPMVSAVGPLPPSGGSFPVPAAIQNHPQQSGYSVAGHPGQQPLSSSGPLHVPNFNEHMHASLQGSSFVGHASAFPHQSPADLSQHSPPHFQMPGCPPSASQASLDKNVAAMSHNQSSFGQSIPFPQQAMSMRPQNTIPPQNMRQAHIQQPMMPMYHVPGVHPAHSAPPSHQSLPHFSAVPSYSPSSMNASASGGSIAASQQTQGGFQQQLQQKGMSRPSHVPSHAPQAIYYGGVSPPQNVWGGGEDDMRRDPSSA